MARTDTVEAAPWGAFLDELAWRQGEHVTLIGPTGCGKTTLAQHLLDRRAYVAVVATKPRDPVVDAFRRRGFRIVKRWPPPITVAHAVYWPLNERRSDLPNVREGIAAMLDDVYASGGWCVYLDELQYCCGRLGLTNHCVDLWHQGRAMNVSVVCAAQRPRHVPLAAYSQASHLFLWPTGDERDLARLGEFGLVDKKTVTDTLSQLDRHDVLYIDPIAGRAVVTKVDIEP